MAKANQNTKPAFNEKATVAAFHAGILATTAGKASVDAGTSQAWAACLAAVKAGKAEEFCGNGLGGKEHIAGKFRDSFTDAEAEANRNSIKSMLCDARKVAEALAAGHKLDLTEGKGKMAAAARLALGGKPKAKKETSESATMTLEQVIASAGIAATLRAVAAILKAERKSATDAKVAEALAVKYA